VVKWFCLHKTRENSRSIQKVNKRDYE